MKISVLLNVRKVLLGDNKFILISWTKNLYRRLIILYRTCFKLLTRVIDLEKESSSPKLVNSPPSPARLAPIHTPTISRFSKILKTSHSTPQYQKTSKSSPNSKRPSITSQWTNGMPTIHRINLAWVSCSISKSKNKKIRTINHYVSRKRTLWGKDSLN